MRIFTRYMAGRFLKPFLFSLGLFALLIFLGDMFDKMHHLVKSKASIGTILQYLWLQVPYWAVRTIPMATLLATLTALTGFMQSGEWIAAQSSGIKTSEFWKPLLWCALGVTALSFLAQETILPACYQRSRRLWQDSIHPEWEWDKYFDIALVGAPGEFVQAKLFLPKDGLMERPLFEKVGPGGIERQLDATKALWDAPRGKWVFHDGVERVFKDGQLLEIPFTTLDSPLTAPPRNLIPRTRNPDEMSIGEIRRYAERIAHLGVPARNLEVAAHGKIAYPFSNLVICALGIPIALRLRRAPKVAVFCLALGVSFFYLWFIEIGRALGSSGTLPPAAAAWTANFVFGAAAATMLSRSKL